MTERFCLKCGLPDAETRMEALHISEEGAALEVFYAHPRCLGEHRGAVNTYQHGEFARALPELQKRKEGKKR
jgi:hypothetical protein